MLAAFFTIGAALVGWFAFAMLTALFATGMPTPVRVAIELVGLAFGAWYGYRQAQKAAHGADDRS